GNGTFPQNMYDTSVKVPAIMSHPGQIPENVVNEDLVSGYDFMPTLLAYTGMEASLPDGLPGRSILPILKGETMTERENVVIYDEYGPVRMIRTREWKYIHRYPYGPHELYDLVNDPGERDNKVDAPACKDILIDMKAHLEEWFFTYVN